MLNAWALLSDCLASNHASVTYLHGILGISFNASVFSSVKWGDMVMLKRMYSYKYVSMLLDRGPSME